MHCRFITSTQRVAWLRCLALADRTTTRALCLASRAADARPLLGTLFSYLLLHSVVTSATCVDAPWAVWENRRGISDSGIGSRCLQTKGSRLPPIPSALFRTTIVTSGSCWRITHVIFLAIDRPAPPSEPGRVHVRRHRGPRIQNTPDVRYFAGAQT